MSLRNLLSVVLCLAAAGSAAAQAPESFDRTIAAFPGLCEASAALPLAPGTFVVADDDEDDLRRYNTDRFSRSADVDISDLEGLDDTSDLEGATRIGDTLYWITSHSTNRQGRQRPQRQRLFAVRIGLDEDEDPQLVGTPYTMLLADLPQGGSFAKFQLGTAATRRAEDPGALNIEGLAAAPDGKLLIGFRNPITDGKALVIPLNNPAGVVVGQPAAFGDPIELDLGGLGIRSLEFWPARNAYVIIAGPFGSSGPFQAFHWSGRSGENPVPMKNIDLAGLIPEAVFVDGDDLIILSDDGDACPADKAFRAARFRPRR